MDAASRLPIGIVGMEKVDLAAERPVARAVLGDEFVKNDFGFALVKTLFHEHADDPILKILQNIGRTPSRHAGDCHEERGAGDVVAVGALGLAIGIAQLLLSFALFAIADLV
jgi:hypothetical protein